MKHLLVLLLLLCSAVANAQDVIVKKDGTTILSKVLEVGQNEIKYKRHDNLDGPTYTIQKSELQAINYQNGAKDTFSATVREENRYLPNNQNDGTQQYNDRALLELDAASHDNLKAMKTKNTFRWVGGSVLTAGTLLWTTAIIAVSFDSNTDWDASAIAAFGIEALGIWGSYALLKSAAKHQKRIKQLQSFSLYQHDIPFSNGSSLSLGANLLSDCTTNNKTLGLGVHYNF